MRNAYLYTKSTFPATAVKIKKKMKTWQRGWESQEKWKTENATEIQTATCYKISKIFSANIYINYKAHTHTHTHRHRIPLEGLHLLFVLFPLAPLPNPT